MPAGARSQARGGSPVRGSGSNHQPHRSASRQRAYFNSFFTICWHHHSPFSVGRRSGRSDRGEPAKGAEGEKVPGRGSYEAGRRPRRLRPKCTRPGVRDRVGRRRALLAGAHRGRVREPSQGSRNNRREACRGRARGPSLPPLRQTIARERSPPPVESPMAKVINRGMQSPREPRRRRRSCR